MKWFLCLGLVILFFSTPTFGLQKTKSATQKQHLKSSKETYNGREIYTGPRGGKYYLNDKGKKVYIKR